MKNKNNWITFDELLLNLKNFLKNNSLKKFFDYIMVDEFQDTDFIQLEILKYLENNNLMVVGDNFQSIYSFRGAEIKNILNFPLYFKNSRTIILRQNYRSTIPIVDFTNYIAKLIPNSFQKNIYSKKASVTLPQLSIFNNFYDECNNLVLFLKELLKNFPTKTFSILFRNHFYMNDYSKTLKENNIPFEIYKYNQSEDFELKNKNSNSSNLVLTTIHSSKGLEWDFVFIPCILDGIIPTSIGDTININEELRLFYVACSRAKEQLFLSYPLSFYCEFGLFKKPSPFLDNIPLNLINLKRGRF